MDSCVVVPDDAAVVVVVVVAVFLGSNTHVDQF